MSNDRSSQGDNQMLGHLSSYLSSLTRRTEITYRIYLDGEYIALISDPQFLEMFWIQYKIQLVSSEKASIDLLCDNDVWHGSRIEFEDVGKKKRFAGVVTADVTNLGRGQICLRGVPAIEPSVLDSTFSYLRRLFLSDRVLDPILDVLDRSMLHTTAFLVVFVAVVAFVRTMLDFFFD